MENDKTEQAKEVCSITLIFPVLSDDEAMSVKKKIGEVVSDIPDARIDFRIANMGRPRV